VIAVVLRQLEPGFELLEGKVVGPVAIHLVRGDEDEGRVRRVPASGLEQVQGPVRVDREVRLRVRGRPVVGGLSRRVDDQREVALVLGPQPLDPAAIADVELERAKARVALDQRPGDTRRRCVRAEEPRPHVVLEPNHVIPGLDQAPHGLGADQPA
jgi:hypothetical protein